MGEPSAAYSFPHLPTNRPFELPVFGAHLWEGLRQTAPRPSTNRALSVRYKTWLLVSRHRIYGNSITTVFTCQAQFSDFLWCRANNNNVFTRRTVVCVPRIKLVFKTRLSQYAAPKNEGGNDLCCKNCQKTVEKRRRSVNFEGILPFVASKDG